MIGGPFTTPRKRPHSDDDRFSADEVRLANRNHGAMLELLRLDVTPAGAHYLLTHFDVPVIDPAAHRLELRGFRRDAALSLDEIRAMPQVTLPVVMECAGNGRAGVHPRSCSMPWMYEAVGCAEWTGTPLWPVLQEAGIGDDVVEVSFTGADAGFDKGVPHRFGRALTVEQLRALDVLLVHAMNGQPLLPQHGAPLRIVVPGWYGMASVKWLCEIEALRAPYTGFQQVETYRLRQDEDDPGRPVTAMRVKSLMVPPGVPDWLTRRRYVEPGPVEIVGRAWSGQGAIARVELGAGDDWQEAEMTPPSGPYGWVRWRVVWQADPGEHVLRCRATDSAGNTQPLAPVWDLAGFANNQAQRVEVYVPAEDQRRAFS